ncbi:MAG: tRNA (guanosine(37)-N1)-methyltransferase TrmD, partial [Roseburia sp.]|nr:tRNA (guanosine(37)-N1)-methyltransferase TrmD [Roseburia sp.]
MNFHILTLFPEMVMQGLSTSIIGRARSLGLLSIEAINIRDYTLDKHNKVDDTPYGGGAGMLMQAQPVYDAWKSVADRTKAKPRTVYLTPQGTTFTQPMAKELAKEEDLVLLCGHYEGIDERVLEEIVTDYVSIGDYVLTGGELPAMVMVDAISRMVPGVLGNEVSGETESFEGNLLEYPQYSRPEEWMGKRVPQVLLSGNQKNISAWRREEAVKRTRERRPDLYQKYEELEKCRAILQKQKLLHIDMTELIARGQAELLYARGGNICLRDKASGICFHTAESLEMGREALLALRAFRMRDKEGALYQADPSLMKEEAAQGGFSALGLLVLHQDFMLEAAEEILGVKPFMSCHQAVYTRREKLS